MNILYIDPICFLSHANFNRLHVSALRKIGAKIDFVFKEGYDIGLNIRPDELVYTIVLKQKHKGGFWFRVYLAIVLFKIKKNIDLNKYDKIILSYYDEISLFFVNFPSSYLINHINISGLSNKIKLWFFKKISKKHIQIVMESYIQNYLESLNVYNSIVVKHGLIDTYSCRKSLCFLKNFKYVVFSPSAVSSDDIFLSEFINSLEVDSFLKETKTVIVIRSKSLKCNSSNIVILKDYILDEDYQSIFMCSNAILITYPASYKYRVSGVLLEAISCRKTVLISDIEMLRQYEYLFGDDAYFLDINGLLKCLLKLTQRNCNSINLTDKQVDDLMPDYSCFL